MAVADERIVIRTKSLLGRKWGRDRSVGVFCVWYLEMERNGRVECWSQRKKNHAGGGHGKLREATDNILILCPSSRET
jgi:hypothetical protein